MIQFPQIPEYAAQATYVQWEPISGSGERITAAVAMVDGNRHARVISLLSPDILSVLYRGQASNAAHLLTLMTESLKTHLGRGLPVDQWNSPISGFTASPLQRFNGISQEDILDQVAGLHSSLYKAKVPTKPARLASRSDLEVRNKVRNAAKRMIGLRADEIFTPDGIIEVEDDGHKHYLDIPLKTGTKVGSIISAWFSSRGTIETHFLRAQSNLSVAAERGKYQAGLFISRPEAGMEQSNVVVMDNVIDDMYWRLKRMGFHLEVAEEPDALAKHILEWAA